MIISFRTNKFDTEVEDQLMKLPSNKERVKFIKEALLFYIKHKNSLDSIDNSLNEINKNLQELKGNGIKIIDDNDGKVKEENSELEGKWNQNLNDLFNF